jgi:hypothetical protein
MKLPILTFVLSILILMENLYLVEKKIMAKIDRYIKKSGLVVNKYEQGTNQKSKFFMASVV